MTYPQPGQKPMPVSFGQIQDTFTFRMRNFINGDQITIVEDSPRQKRPRTAIKKGKNQDYTVCLLKISVNNVIADLELYDYELSQITAACPKLDNFKGATLAFDGRYWQYICSDMPTPRDPRQPDLYPATPPQQQQDQKDMFLKQLVDKMKTAKEFAIVCDESKVSGWADKISPNGSIELISYGKLKGAFVESQGIFRVIE